MRENLNDRTSLSELPGVALSDEAGECFPHRLQIRKFAVDEVQFMDSQGASFSTSMSHIQLQKQVYFFQSEAKDLCPLDKTHALCNFRGISPTAAHWLRWFHKQPSPLIITDRLNVHAGSADRALPGQDDLCSTFRRGDCG